jgi:hypothetical protein
MNPRTKYHAQWRKAQKAALPSALRETKAYVSEETYGRLIFIAESRKERLPITIGRVLDYAIAVMDGNDPENVSLLPEQPATLKVRPEALFSAILASRFPEDTGAARMRQFAFVQIVADHNARGEAPTSTEMAAFTGGHRAQMDLLSKQLQARGVITRKHAPGHRGAKSAKLLFIADDALEQMNEAHIKETGLPIPGIEAHLIKPQT